jgi:hypothetical protein
VAIVILLKVAHDKIYAIYKQTNEMVLQVRNREPFCHTITDDELSPGPAQPSEKDAKSAQKFGQPCSLF